ncbi:MAG: right-handed parallel beta-helix repeat-containing protein [Prevotella sp.]|nr:right-handed parallel beta-helix repeat-containing protein [Prevotella sp.]
MEKKIKSLMMCCAALLLFAITSCTDDESFTSSSENRLTFSSDTIRMDTVFSRVPTPAKTMWVYNNSGDGLRCTNVRLQNGNQSGLRVNVDGIYLGSEVGYQTSNVEIRDKDSLRVFIELTSPEMGYDDPQLLQDKLLFTLESGVVQEVPLEAFSWDAELIRDMVISRDTIFEGNKPRVIYGEMKINEGATLTLAPGTQLYFHGDAGMEVSGTLRSLGTAEENVVLRGDRLDYMFDYLPYDLVSGRWKGLVFREPSYDNILQYTDLHSANDGIVCDSADISRPKLTLQSSTIHNSQGYGLYATHCHIEAYNSQITNALRDCLCFYGGEALLIHCTVAQYYPFDSMRGYALRFQAAKDLPMVLLCANSIVTGYAEDVILGGQENDDDEIDYQFVNSILRSPEVDDKERFVNIMWEDPKDTTEVWGEKHFMLVDLQRQHYDFHLAADSKAKDYGSADYALPLDRDGSSRDDKPDAGCFEVIEPKS